MKMRIIIAICIFFIGAYSCATAAEIPELGEYVVEAVGDNLFADADFKIGLISKEENSVTIKVPLLVGADIPGWKICASIGYTDGQKWMIIPQDNYERDTTVENGYIMGKIILPEKENGWYWVRIWGKNIQSGDWLLINQNSQYCRDDINGNPGYEFLVHPGSGKSRPIVEKYKKRK